MPTYKITDPTTGRVVRLTGDSPPTESELDHIFGVIHGGAGGEKVGNRVGETLSEKEAINRSQFGDTNYSKKYEDVAKENGYTGDVEKDYGDISEHNQIYLKAKPKDVSKSFNDIVNYHYKKLGIEDPKEPDLFTKFEAAARIALKNAVAGGKVVKDLAVGTTKLLAKGLISDVGLSGAEGVSRGLSELMSGVASEDDESFAFAGGIGKAVKELSDKSKGFFELISAKSGEAKKKIEENLEIKSPLLKGFAGDVVNGIGQTAGFVALSPVKGAQALVIGGVIFQEGVDDYRNTQAAAGKEIDPDKELDAGIKNLPSALLEYASNRIIAIKSLKPLIGKVKVKNVPGKIAMAAGSEGLTEGAQQWWSNFSASTLAKFDPDRPLTQGMIHAMAVGAFSAGGLSMAGHVTGSFVRDFLGKGKLVNDNGTPLSVNQFKALREKLNPEVVSDIHAGNPKLGELATAAMNGNAEAAKAYNAEIFDVLEEKSDSAQALNSELEPSRKDRLIENVNSDKLAELSDNVNIADTAESKAPRFTRGASKRITKAVDAIQAEIDSRIKAIESITGDNEQLSLEDSLRAFNELRNALPPNIRNRLRGLDELLEQDLSKAPLRSVKPENRAKFIKTKMNTVRNIVRDVFTKDALKNTQKIINKEVPKTASQLKSLKGRRGFKYQKLLKRINEIAKTDSKEVALEISKLEDELDSKELPETRQHEILERINLLRKFGDLSNKSKKRKFSKDDFKLALDALSEIETIRANGISSYRKFVEDRRLKNESLRVKSLSSILGDEALMSAAEIQQNSKKKKPFLDKLKDFFTGETMTESQSFFTLLDALVHNKNEPQGQSFLSNHFGDSVHIAENNKFTGIQTENNKLHEFLVKDLYKGKNIKQIRQILDKNREVIDSTGIYFKDKKNSRNRELAISKEAAITIYAQQKDTTLAETFNEMGYTKETFKQIEEFIGDDGKKLGDWLLNFYEGYGQKVNNFFEEAEGYSLALVNNYSPIARVTDAQLTDPDFDQKNGPFATAKNGSLKQRVSNKNPLVFDNAMSVFYRHTSMMEHYMAYRKVEQEMRAVLRSADVQNAIKQMDGLDAASALNRQIDTILRSNQSALLYSKQFDEVRVNITVSSLAFNPGVLLKQLTSIPAYANSIPTWAFLKNSSDFWKDPIGHYKILAQSPYIQQRMSEGYERDVALMAVKDDLKNLLQTKDIRDRAMVLVRLGDMGAVAIGGWSVYKYHLDRLNKKGDPKAHEKALLEFEKATRDTQQSSRNPDLGLIQKAGSFAKLFTMYMTAPLSYLRLTVQAIRNARRGRISKTQLAKTIFIYQFLLPNLFQFVADGFLLWTDDDEQTSEFFRRHLVATALGPLSGFVFWGQVAEVAANTLTGGPSFLNTSANPVFSQLDSIVTDNIKNMKNLAAGDLTYKEVEDALVDLTSIGNIKGFPFFAIARFAQHGKESLVDDAKFYPQKLFLGYGDYALAEKNLQEQSRSKGSWEKFKKSNSSR